MSEYLHKSHNVTVQMYHMAFPAKYRNVIFADEVDAALQTVCSEIVMRYQLKFLEIGSDKDDVHFFVQLVPKYSMTEIVTIIKSISAREVFRRCPKVKNNYRVENCGLMLIKPAR
jgi:putative transposase